MRLLTLLLMVVMCVEAPAVAQALSPAAQNEIRRLESQASAFRHQSPSPAACTRLKQKAAEWRARAATLTSPWRDNLLASATQEDAGAERCLKNSTGTDDNEKYSLAQADRIRKHAPLALRERSPSVTEKYNRTRKALQEIISSLHAIDQRLAVEVPRMRALVGDKIALGPHLGSDAEVSGIISQSDVDNNLGNVSEVRRAASAADERYEKLYYAFADKFTSDASLEDPRNVVFNIDAEYTGAVNAIEFAWVAVGTEVAWQLEMKQLAANVWSGQQDVLARAEAHSLELERGAALTAAQNDPGNPNAVVGNRTGSESLLKFEAATDARVKAYCERYQKALGNQLISFAPEVQAAASTLSSQRLFLMQVRDRLAKDLPYASDLNRNGRTALNYRAHEFSSAWSTNWPSGLALIPAVVGRGHPHPYIVNSRIGFVACPYWREQMPTNISSSYPAVTPKFADDDTAWLNVNLINSLILEGEAEGRAPGQQL